MSRETRIVLFILSAWLVLALATGIPAFFRNASAPAVAITIWTLTGVALVMCWAIPSVRRWTAVVDLRWLVALHLTRFVGVYFLILGSRGALPQAFAKPAGIGDIVIALGAVAILSALRRHTFLLIWNTLGLIDIVLVVFTALRCGLHDWTSMAPLREFPLSLLPTFIVPLIIASHIVIFIRLARRQSVR